MARSQAPPPSAPHAHWPQGTARDMLRGGRRFFFFFDFSFFRTPAPLPGAAARVGMYVHPPIPAPRVVNVILLFAFVSNRWVRTESSCDGSMRDHGQTQAKSTTTNMLSALVGAFCALGCVLGTGVAGQGAAAPYVLPDVDAALYERDGRRSARGRHAGARR